MKKFLLAALLALTFVAASAREASAGVCGSGWFCLCCPSSGGGGHCGSGHCGGGHCGGGGHGCGQLGPWYSYWPMAAHFQTPSPLAFPYWPSAAAYGSAPFAHSPADYYSGNGYGH
jgi:hypothetical protein